LLMAVKKAAERLNLRSHPRWLLAEIGASEFWKIALLSMNDLNYRS